MNLDHIPTEDKSAAFDALMLLLDGKGRFISNRRVIKEVKTGPAEVVMISKDVPTYEFVLRIDGHNDITAAVLGLLTTSAKLNG